VAILVSRYNELVTTRLLEGARACCREAGLDESQVDVVWTPGAFELPAAAAAAAESGRYVAIVALGAVVRGDTPHFDFVAGEAARGLGDVAVRYRMAVAFGVLTVDTMQQALDRAGGTAGNKGFEAAAAAIETADVIGRLRSADAAT
jgi:6,7-dimethyl-8-ribityllumazine synthase